MKCFNIDVHAVMVLRSFLCDIIMLFVCYWQYEYVDRMWLYIYISLLQICSPIG